MEVLLAFAAALVAFRLAGNLASRWRATRRPELAAWCTSLLAYALAAGALAWGAAAGWNDESFRVYYTCGGLLTAPLLGVGSLLLNGATLGCTCRVAVCRPCDRRRHRRTVDDARDRNVDSASAGSSRARAGAHPRDRRQLARHTCRHRCRSADDATTSRWQCLDSRRCRLCSGRKRGCGPRSCANRTFHCVRCCAALFGLPCTR